MRGFTQEALVCRAHKRPAGLRFDLDVWIDAKRASSCTIDRQNECIGLSAASSWIVHAAKHMLCTYAFAKQWQGNLTTWTADIQKTVSRTSIHLTLSHSQHWPSTCHRFFARPSRAVTSFFVLTLDDCVETAGFIGNTKRMSTYLSIYLSNPAIYLIHLSIYLSNLSICLSI